MKEILKGFGGICILIGVVSYVLSALFAPFGIVYLVFFN
jgi:hypothetical protein